MPADPALKSRGSPQAGRPYGWTVEGGEMGVWQCVASCSTRCR